MEAAHPGRGQVHLQLHATTVAPHLDFQTVNLSGDASIYYVYAERSQAGHSTPSAIQIVTSTTQVSLLDAVKPPRSLKGFSKTGIILFECFNYGGELKC